MATPNEGEKFAVFFAPTKPISGFNKFNLKRHAEPARDDMSKIRAIRTEVDYRDARARIAALADAEDGTPEAYERDILSDLVELYEARTPTERPPRWARNSALCRYLNISAMCLWRWARSETLGFPPAAIINKVEWRDLNQVDDWMRSQVVRRNEKTRPDTNLRRGGSADAR